MCKVVGALFFLGIGFVVCHPAKDALMFEMGGDTAVVESTVREARQVPAHLRELLKPGVKDAFILTYGNKAGDAGDVQGYSKKLNDRGNEGYEHFDSFHKKDADKYGFEVHKEFGKSNKAGVDVKNKKHGYSSDEEKEDAEESKTLYRVSGETKEDDKDKNRVAVDGYGMEYYGGGGGSGKESGGKSENESEGGGSKNYEVNESYEQGGSTSYEGGHDNESDEGGNHSSGSGEGKSQSYSAEKEEDGEEEEEEDDD